MDKESLHAAKNLRRSFHALARKVLNHNVSRQKLDEIAERLESFQNEIARRNTEVVGAGIRFG